MSDKIPTEKRCGYNKFQRLKFFHGMLLDDKDFTTEQQYHIEKRKMHNRMLHGWGVVCGFDIIWENCKKWFTVEPGYALDCHGNEILMCEDTKIDLTEMVCAARQSTTTPTPQEKCQELSDDPNLKEYFIGIRYKDSITAPVPVYIPNDDCNKNQCDCSRYKEGFCIEVRQSFTQPSIPIKDNCGLYKQIDEIPQNDKTEAEKKMAKKNELLKFLGKRQKEGSENCNFCNTPPPCPSCCPEEHFVILGKITIQAADKKIVDIDINDCRTYVWTPHLFQYLHLNIFKGVDSFAEYVEFLYHLIKIAKKCGTEEYDNINLIKLFNANPIKSLCLLGEAYLKCDVPEQKKEGEYINEDV